MYILTTTPGFLMGSGVPYDGGWVMEIPSEYYNPNNMTRLGTTLTTDQVTQLRHWSTTNPGWPWPIHAT